MTKVWLFEYCCSIYESSFDVISIHESAVSAYKAMKKDKLESYIDWYDDRALFGKDKHKHGSHERWRVRAFNVNP